MSALIKQMLENSNLKNENFSLRSSNAFLKAEVVSLSADVEALRTENAALRAEQRSDGLVASALGAPHAPSHMHRTNAPVPGDNGESGKKSSMRFSLKIHA
jgi:hypothetical protein